MRVWGMARRRRKGAGWPWRAATTVDLVHRARLYHLVEVRLCIVDRPDRDLAGVVPDPELLTPAQRRLCGRAAAGWFTTEECDAVGAWLVARRAAALDRFPVDLPVDPAGVEDPASEPEGQSGLLRLWEDPAWDLPFHVVGRFQVDPTRGSRDFDASQWRTFRGSAD